MIKYTNSAAQHADSSLHSVSNNATLSLADIEAVNGKKEMYRIAILLPFQLNEVTKDSFGNYGLPDKLSSSSQVAVQFYQGVLLALDTLKKENSNLELYVFDSRGLANETDSLLQLPQMAKMDLIIGPIFNAELDTAARYGLQHKIFIVSPFSSVTSFLSKNAFYIVSNATIRTHCEALMDYILENNKNENILFLQRNDETDSKLAQYFLDEVKYAHPSDWHYFNYHTLIDSNDSFSDHIADYLSDSGKNIIVIPSNDEDFVNNTLEDLYNLSSRFKIELFGMPTWRNYTSLKWSELFALDTHISSGFFGDVEDSNFIDFKNNFKNRFGVKPSEYSLQGYNQMYYFGHMLETQGLNFLQTVSDSSFTAIGGSFLFQQATNNLNEKNNPMDFWENKNVEILEYQVNGLVPAE
jgi:ABC-type branched-subunit amino acid transport system substrate-binding protein